MAAHLTGSQASPSTVDLHMPSKCFRAISTDAVEADSVLERIGR